MQTFRAGAFIPAARALTMIEGFRYFAGAAAPVRSCAMNVRLLGPLEVEYGRTPVRLGPAGQRALLARLLLDANRTVAVERLVDDLWGHDMPPTAFKMVQIHVSRLRKVLPDGVLVTHAPGYALEIAPEALDLVRFDRLREQGRAALARGSAAEAAHYLRDALALWRGPALAEFGEPFAALEGRRLEELRVACLEDRIDADLALGGHAPLIGELAALVAHHPLRERLQRQLMLALYRSGRQAEALAGYRRVRQMLSSELGIEPSPALRELERRMLQQDPALDGAAAGPSRHRKAAGERSARRTAARLPRRGACASRPRGG
jgi:SARP family transcriptional regulator, regulator of embCAB operon